jgi:Tfp pilus assembly protein PilF
MKLISLAAVFFIGFLAAARAQQEADEQYLSIYNILQQAENLGEKADPRRALASLTEAYTELEKFQRIYPDWNPAIVNYRLEDLGKKIADARGRVQAAGPPETGASNEIVVVAQPSAAEATLRAQLRLAQSENETLQAKLKEALSSQPPAANAGDLDRAQEAIRALIKENDLLKATVESDRLTNGPSALRRQLSEALDQSAAEHRRAEKLASDNAAIQRDFTARRDELARELAASKKKSSQGAEAQSAALREEIQTLRARLAVAEAKPAPFTAGELELFRQTMPQPLSDPAMSASNIPAATATPTAAPTGHSVHELPGGTVELVDSAQRHFSNHEYDAAEADYRKILDLDRNNALALANLAAIELQENKLEDAEKHITMAVAENPNDAYNLATLGFLRFSQGKYDDALDTLSRAAALDSNNPEIQNYLGVTLSHKGLRLQAEAALRKAIQLNPDYAPAHNNLAVVYLNQTPPSPLLARWHYQKAVADGQPRNPDLEKLLAEKGAPVEP